MLQPAVHKYQHCKVPHAFRVDTLERNTEYNVLGKNTTHDCNFICHQEIPPL